MTDIFGIDDTLSHYNAYNFYAEKTGLELFNSIDKFKEIKNNLHFQRTFWVYEIDSNKILSFAYGNHDGRNNCIIRTVNDKVTEFFKLGHIKFTNQTNWISYTLDGKTKIEYYDSDYENKLEKKYDWRENKLKQVNYVVTFNDLDDETQNLLKDFEYKQNIFIYAQKPYGRVLYVYSKVKYDNTILF